MVAMMTMMSNLNEQEFMKLLLPRLLNLWYLRIGNGFVSAVVA
jgi:hypothetical protein